MLRILVHIDLSDGSYVSWVEQPYQENDGEFEEYLKSSIGPFTLEDCNDPTKPIYGFLESGVQTDFHVASTIGVGHNAPDIVGGFVKELSNGLPTSDEGASSQ